LFAYCLLSCWVNLVPLANAHTLNALVSQRNPNFPRHDRLNHSLLPVSFKKMRVFSKSNKDQHHKKQSLRIDRNIFRLSS
jgi:hypothetical protein